ncbi:Iron-sulfur cluster carrier protein [Beijerinckiaceae bacterium RH AL1]|nr:Iron-sulfur cluster carrier protein [Beijerinckiaceae bacterium RH CH11]VVB45777.1 Iron-sulfur cluster carrier protein [Beijerinckiaceae bacterium RH AL8]VVC54997.1 Iron-sulfur cluster carrier protein [Beijerinckiaceae bacterium RH AL1]
MITEQEVLEALSTVAGPDGRTCVSRSNGIAGLTIREGKVFLALTGDPRLAEAMETMRAEAEKQVAALPGVERAVVTLTAEKPDAPTRPAQGHRPAAPKNLAVPGVARIIAVASGKGGVGKSTTAVNLALGLVASGWRVGLLDADVFGPSLPRLLGLDGVKPELEGKMLKPLYVFGLKAMSIGFLVPEGEAMIWRGPMVMSAINQLLREVDWGELDCLVVDMPPGTGDAQLTLAQSVPLAGAVIVSTPQDLALIDARRGVTMFQKTSVPILGVVENMSYFVCPHCQGRSDIFAHGGARHEAEAMGVPFLGEVPLALQIREQADAGRPTVAVAPDSAAGQAYREIAGRVRAGLEGARQRQAPRIVVE